MKNFLHLPIFIFSFLYLAPLMAMEKTIYCTHTELCRLAQIVFHENHIQDREFKTLVKIVGDPHEYLPSSNEIKSLISAPLLITGPIDLNPWIKKINYQRTKTSNLKTINLVLEKKHTDLYTGANNEALSHFWLYPKIFCELRNNLEAQLIVMNIMEVIPARRSCAKMIQELELSLKSTLEKIKIPLILTHDALLPLLASIKKSEDGLVAIKGSGHHQEATPKAVKKLYDALIAPKVIWIEETGISVPANLMAKKRSDDIIIKIDTANSQSDEYFQILTELNQKLQALKL